MRHTSTTLTTLAACAAFCVAPLAHADDFSFAGLLADGPLASVAFTGTFSVDSSPVPPLFDGELPLAAFSLQMGTQTYTLASADLAPTAVFAQGQFSGLAYLDADAADVGLRPQLAFVPGFDSFAGAYLAYVTAPDAGGTSAGFGSYSVSAVPEPAAVALWLMGLSGLAAWNGAKRRRRAA